MAIKKDPVITQSYLDKKFAKFLGDLDDYFQKQQESIDQSRIEILGRLQSMEENSAVATYQNAENSDVIEDHEKRIGAIEVKLQLI